ncbi:unknown (plasmid) [Halobacterium salinarum NRC-1]|uniref:Spurious ORF n=1 Tax=Halobacterium salinarum (strain ATCC 700922 / JCM 11081 / NRC-1) TaxID=64091 RepID=O52017_HALSA|nr:unknown [Halobacterium salinarum NRC-1]DAC79606.1 TPA_inf: spurious ORF [Halobacterium salinarum NRC-1]
MQALWDDAGIEGRRAVSRVRQPRHRDVFLLTSPGPSQLLDVSAQLFTGGWRCCGGLLEEAEVGEPLMDDLECVVGVVWVAPTRDDEFAAAEQQHHNIGVVEAIDEAGELFGFVFDVFEAESDGDRVQVQILVQTAAADDILDVNRRTGRDVDTEVAEVFDDDTDGVVDVVDRLGAGADSFARVEDERRRFRIVEPVDDTRKIPGIVLSAGEVSCELLEG